MAKRFKNRRYVVNNTISILKQKLRSPKTIAAFIGVIALVVFLFLIKNYLLNNPDFMIKEVELQGEGIANTYLSEGLSQIGIGENIFAINLEHMEASIKNDYFEVKDIRVERVFPDRLIFYITKRKTIALVNSREYYPVDKEGTVLKDVSRTIKEGLPVIDGIYLNQRDIGSQHTSPKLVQSLVLLDALSRSGILEEYNVSGIDAANSRNLSFYIRDGLQIKIGGEDFENRLELLKKLLKDPSIDLATVRYIDLRFKDVVIGPK